MSVYISGPMSGYVQYNRPVFFDAERKLKDKYPGLVVLNPARLPVGLMYEEYMRLDMAMVDIASQVIVLPGHEDSPGARAEVAYAKALRKIVITLEHALTKSIMPGESEDE
jgi:hypothetical protein